jgi:hypothetical protein
MPDGAKEIRREGAIDRQDDSTFPEHTKDVMHDILGAGALTHVPIRDVPHGGMVCSIELLERGLVPIADPRHQRHVFGVETSGLSLAMAGVVGLERGE